MPYIKIGKKERKVSNNNSRSNSVRSSSIRSNNRNSG
jgi:hypothetical protein